MVKQLRAHREQPKWQGLSILAETAGPIIQTILYQHLARSDFPLHKERKRKA